MVEKTKMAEKTKMTDNKERILNHTLFTTKMILQHLEERTERTYLLDCKPLMSL